MDTKDLIDRLRHNAKTFRAMMEYEKLRLSVTDGAPSKIDYARAAETYDQAADQIEYMQKRLDRWEPKLSVTSALAGSAQSLQPSQ